MNIYTHIDNLNNYKKSLVIEKMIREFLESQDYLKVELPILTPVLIPESYLEVFKTELIYLDKKQELFLIPTPELYQKRLLSQGIRKCYYFGKSFRNNEKNSSLHNPEFTMLEYYQTNIDYMDIARELLTMLQYISQKVYKKDGIFYQNKYISFSKWEKITVTDAFEKYANIKEQELFNHQLFNEKAKTKGYQTDGFSYIDLWSQIFVQEIEPHLGVNGFPTLLYDYPKELAALSKLSKNQKTAERFEFYIMGIELGNCYTELTNWKELEMRYNNEENLRKENDKIIHPVDKGLIQAVKYGLNNCAGISIGFERLAMIFCDATSIEQMKLITIE